MELCQRCHGGEIHAPNCPVCSGSGFVGDQASTSQVKSMVGAPVSAKQRRILAQSFRRAREEEKRRRVRVGTVQDDSKPKLTLEEHRDREKWRHKYHLRQERRKAEEQRRRRLTAKQLEDEDRKRREKAYMRRLNQMKLAEKGTGKPLQAKRDHGSKRARSKPRRISREERSAQQARNNQLEEKLSLLLQLSPEVGDSASPSNKNEGATAGKGKHAGRSGRYPQAKKPLRGGSNRDFPGGNPKPDSLHEVRQEFTTVLPGFENEEDASRYMGHSFRDHGGYGSIPMYDDYDE